VGNADAQTFNRNELIVHKQEWDLPLPRRHSSLLVEIFKTFTWGIGFDLQALATSSGSALNGLDPLTVIPCKTCLIGALRDWHKDPLTPIGWLCGLNS
jgi:hypothetical protein